MEWTHLSAIPCTYYINEGVETAILHGRLHMGPLYLKFTRCEYEGGFLGRW